MKLDFWNNPIIVSSFRMKARKGNPMNWLVGYPMAWLLVGMAVPYFAPNIARDWPRYAFYALIGLQLLLLGIMAGSATSNSLKAEVAKQTLDFQRISCLSARQILLGKLLAESATPFFLAISTIPLGVLCYALGGVPLEVMLLAFLNLLANILLCGALGLVMQLEMRGNKVQGGGLWALPLFIEMQATGGLVAAGAWLVTILVVLPFVQVLLAFLAFHIMQRRLDNPMNPPMSRPVSYALLVLLDGVAAWLLYYFDPPFATRAVIFSLVHLGIGLMLVFSFTAWRESIKSWAWRFRGRLPWWKDSLLANRSENAVGVLACTLIGLAGLFLFVVWPGVYSCEPEEVRQGWQAVVGCAILTPVLFLSLGTVYQWCMLIAGRNGAGVYVGFVAILVMVPELTGLYLKARAEMFPGMAAPVNRPGEPLEMTLPLWIMSLSPVAHYGQWLVEPDRPLNLVPVLAVYGGLLGLSWYSLRARLGSLVRIIDRKLGNMGVIRKPGGEVAQPALSS